MNYFLPVPGPPAAEFVPDGGRSWKILFHSFRVSLPQCFLHPGSLGYDGSWFISTLWTPVLHNLVSCGQDNGGDEEQDGVHGDGPDVVPVRVQNAMVCSCYRLNLYEKSQVTSWGSYFYNLFVNNFKR